MKKTLIISVLFSILLTTIGCGDNFIFKKGESQYELLTNTARTLTEHTATSEGGIPTNIMYLIVTDLEYPCYAESIYEFKNDSIYANQYLCSPHDTKWYFGNDSVSIYIFETPSIISTLDSNAVFCKKEIIELTEDVLKIEFEVINEDVKFIVSQTYETVY